MEGTRSAGLSSRSMDGAKLTDGLIGPPYAGGIGPVYALCWQKGDEPVIELDLGRPEMCGAFRIHISAGWPWWDAMKGQVLDKVEVLTSIDGSSFTSQGFFSLNCRCKDIAINHMMPDDETAAGFTYELVLARPAAVRHVRFGITPERIITVSEVQVLDFIRYEPFDLRIALPDEGHLVSSAEEAGQRDRLAYGRMDCRSGCRQAARRSNGAVFNFQFSRVE